MVENDCTLSEAQKLVLEERMHVKAFAANSSPKRREVLGEITDAGNRLMNSVYKTILDKISPRRLVVPA